VIGFGHLVVERAWAKSPELGSDVSYNMAVGLSMYHFPSTAQDDSLREYKFLHRPQLSPVVAIE
jgi:hypothetical protein